MDTTLELVKYLYKPAADSAVIVKVLQDLGAVPFCKTNVPQGIISISGTNPIFGTTTNAHNPKLSAGGSSAGTGALVGAGGAPFGTGTDVSDTLKRIKPN
jgi:Asp-tRNA(Asn)/Glu-tRNA(Gln) amidotransferase A subunit family amidase